MGELETRHPCLRGHSAEAPSLALRPRNAVADNLRDDRGPGIDAGFAQNRGTESRASADAANTTTSQILEIDVGAIADT